MKRIVLILCVGFLAMVSSQSLQAQCDPPSIIWDEDGELLNWIAKDNATGHIVRYRLAGTFMWTDVEVDKETFFDISFLETCETYEFRVRSICGSEQSSNTPLYTTAVNCGTCFAEYCEIPLLNDGISSINYVRIKDYENFSTQSGFGYEDFRGSNDLQLSPGEIVELEIALSENSFAENDILMYIDYNRNKVFEEDELVANEFIGFDMPVEMEFTVPTDIDFGITRIRFVLSTFSYNQEICQSINDGFWGEVEEYCARLGEEPSLCDVEFETTLLEVQEGTATFEWEELDAAAGYNFRYKKTSESEEDWTTLSTFENFTTIGDIEDCSEYEFELRGVCPFDTSAYKNRIVFESFCATATEELNITEITAYPNPWSSIVTLKMEAKEAKDIRISAVGLNGQRFTATNTFRLNSGANQIEINEFTDLNPGVYMLELSDSQGGIWYHKTIKIQ